MDNEFICSQPNHGNNIVWCLLAAGAGIGFNFLVNKEAVQPASPTAIVQPSKTVKEFRPLADEMAGLPVLTRSAETQEMHIRLPLVQQGVR